MKTLCLSRETWVEGAFAQPFLVHSSLGVSLEGGQGAFPHSGTKSKAQPPTDCSVFKKRCRGK